MHLSQSALSRVVARLEADGLVARADVQRGPARHLRAAHTGGPRALRGRQARAPRRPGRVAGRPRSPLAAGSPLTDAFPARYPCCRDVPVPGPSVSSCAAGQGGAGEKEIRRAVVPHRPACLARCRPWRVRARAVRSRRAAAYGLSFKSVGSVPLGASGIGGETDTPVDVSLADVNGDGEQDMVGADQVLRRVGLRRRGGLRLRCRRAPSPLAPRRRGRPGRAVHRRLQRRRRRLRGRHDRRYREDRASDVRSRVRQPARERHDGHDGPDLVRRRRRRRGRRPGHRRRREHRRRGPHQTRRGAFARRSAPRHLGRAQRGGHRQPQERRRGQRRRGGGRHRRGRSSSGPPGRRPSCR